MSHRGIEGERNGHDRAKLSDTEISKISKNIKDAHGVDVTVAPGGEYVTWTGPDGNAHYVHAWKKIPKRDPDGKVISVAIGAYLNEVIGGQLSQRDTTN